MDRPLHARRSAILQGETSAFDKSLCRSPNRVRSRESGVSGFVALVFCTNYLGLEFGLSDFYFGQPVFYLVKSLIYLVIGNISGQALMQEAKGVINNQFLITGFSIKSLIHPFFQGVDFTLNSGQNRFQGIGDGFVRHFAILLDLSGDYFNYYTKSID